MQWSTNPYSSHSNSKTTKQDQKNKRKGQNRAKGREGTNDAGVLMGVPFVHGDVVPADEEESEVAILMSNGVNPKVVNPSEVLECAPSSAAAVAGVALRRPDLRPLPLRSDPLHHHLLLRPHLLSLSL